MGWKKFDEWSFPNAQAPCVRRRIGYKNDEFPGVKIYSSKHAEPHASGSGEWYWTDYTVTIYDAVVKIFHRMIDAKLAVQEGRL